VPVTHGDGDAVVPPVNVFEPEDLPERPDESGQKSYVPHASDFQTFEERIRAGADALGELFLAVPNGPFLLLLRADDPAAFLAYARQRPSHDVHISWDWDTENGTEWEIRPAGAPGAYRLRFSLPDELAEWIFERAEEAAEQAARAKRRYLSRISVYRHVDGRDELFSLTYQPGATRRTGTRLRSSGRRTGNRP
jgi:hypothetical protein